MLLYGSLGPCYHHFARNSRCPLYDMIFFYVLLGSLFSVSLLNLFLWNNLIGHAFLYAKPQDFTFHFTWWNFAGVNWRVYIGDISSMQMIVLCAELLQAESAIAALNCSGVVLGSLPIRWCSRLFFVITVFVLFYFYFSFFFLDFCIYPYVIRMQGKPVKDACSAPCSSPSAALNHLSCLLDWFTADSL